MGRKRRNNTDVERKSHASSNDNTSDAARDNWNPLIVILLILFAILCYQLGTVNESGLPENGESDQNSKRPESGNTDQKSESQTSAPESGWRYNYENMETQWSPFLHLSYRMDFGSLTKTGKSVASETDAAKFLNIFY